MKRLSALAALGLLAACGQGDGPTGPVSEEAAEASASAEAAAASYSYEVRLVFGPQVAEALAERGGQVSVTSEYFGKARTGAGAKERNGDGQVIIDRADVQVEPVDQLVRIVSPVIQPASLKDIEGEPMLLVNVSAAGQASPETAISCSDYNGSLAVATVRPILIECGLTAAAGAPEPAETP